MEWNLLLLFLHWLPVAFGCSVKINCSKVEPPFKELYGPSQRQIFFRVNKIPSYMDSHGNDEPVDSPTFTVNKNERKP